MSSTSSGWGSGPRTWRWPSRSQEHNERAPRLARIRASFVEQQAAFGWHRGMLLDGATMQVSFLKDLVTLRNPTSRVRFLTYLHGQGRLVDFINHKIAVPARGSSSTTTSSGPPPSPPPRRVRDARSVAVHPVTGPDGEVDQIDVVLRDARATRRRRASCAPATSCSPPAWCRGCPRASQRGTADLAQQRPAARLASSRPSVGAAAASSSSAPGRAPPRRRRTCTTASSPRRGALGVLPVRLQPGRRQPVRQPHLRPRGRRPLLRGLRRGQADAARTTTPTRTTRWSTWS